MAVGTPQLLLDENITMTATGVTSSSFTVVGGANSFLICQTGFNALDDLLDIMTLSTDGSMTVLGQGTIYGFEVSVGVLVGATAGSQTVFLDDEGSSTVGGRVRIIEMSGVDATTPHDTIITRGVDGGTPETQDVTSATDDMVIAGLMTNATPVQEQTLLGSVVSDAGGIQHATQYAAGASTVSMDWTSVDALKALFWLNVNAAATGSAAMVFTNNMMLSGR